MILAGCLLLATAPAFADRFYTWVDAQGHLHTTKIQEPENPIFKRAEEVKKAEAQKKAESRKKVESRKKAENQKTGRQGKEPRSASTGQISEGKPQPLHDAGPEATSAPVQVESPATAAEAAPTAQREHPVSAPAKAQTTPLSTAVRSSAPKDEGPAAGKHSAADSQYNLKNYPDGEDLARHGYVRDPNHRPFYSWVDAMGIEHSTPYQPPPDKQELESTRKRAKGAGPVAGHSLYTEARILRPGMATGIPRTANPAAIKFLGLDKTPSLFASFTAHCCQKLAKVDMVDLPADRSFEVKLDEKAPEHRFSTGLSPYKLVKLPVSGKPYDLQLRSFIHHGVFVPSLVFMTRDFKVTRVVTDLVFDYSPETWFRYGFLHARLPVHPDRGERWLLIFSRKKDINDVTVIERDGQTLNIPHKGSGSIGLEKVGAGVETASIW